MSTAELDYRIRWLATHPFPGSHRARLAGAGQDWRGSVPLTEGRGTLRLDLRASARDPLERAWVHEYTQRSRVPVLMVADLSRSMQFHGRSRRLHSVAQFARAVSAGAFRRGDPFGFIGCDREVRRDWIVPPRVSRDAGERVARRLEDLATSQEHETRAQARGADALALLAPWLPRRRALVFLLSDLHMDPALFERSLARLVAHEVIVLLLADSAERQPPARWGLARLQDLETGRERLLFLRPGQAQRMAQAQHEHQQRMRQLARRHHAGLVVAEDGIDLAQVARQFLAVA